jgi:hypothetical protein
LITLFEAEHAIYTTDIASDVESLLKFIFNAHDLLNGKVGYMEAEEEESTTSEDEEKDRVVV